MAVKPSSRHRQTIERIFSSPVSGDIRWTDIESLFKALGAKISEGQGSRVRINFGTFVSVYHRPHPHSATRKGAVKAVREDLKRLGVAVTPVEEE